MQQQQKQRASEERVWRAGGEGVGTQEGRRRTLHRVVLREEVSLQLCEADPDRDTLLGPQPGEDDHVAHANDHRRKQHSEADRVVEDLFEVAMEAGASERASERARERERERARERERERERVREKEKERERKKERKKKRKKEKKKK